MVPGRNSVRGGRSRAAILFVGGLPGSKFACGKPPGQQLEQLAEQLEQLAEQLEQLAEQLEQLAEQLEAANLLVGSLPGSKSACGKPPGQQICLWGAPGLRFCKLHLVVCNF